eukprot:TRINITY_DN24933_c0_g1_i1.p1 TRINITY_DN24933_c0_g1~~TRINITY_DN24933_c0_g1_i1.p1  ORF type:complete len:606 (-),score=135.09 TRINITY_DN24933_c0_g1_i1:38-1825(-)
MVEEEQERDDEGAERESDAAEEGGPTKGKVVEEPLTLEQAEACDVREVATDKHRSRQLQRTLAKGDPEVVKLLLRKAEPFASELALDQCGNYLLQKVLEAGDDACFMQRFRELHQRLPELAQDMHGTRVAQKVVEQAVHRGLTQELVQALPPEVLPELSLSMTGFHVAAKLIELLPDDQVGAFMKWPSRFPLQLAMDQWGCCVLKKCIDRCEAGELRDRMITTIIESTRQLVKDPFGNYIVQHLALLPERPNSYVPRIVEQLQGQMLEMCTEKFSSNVLEKCLQSASEKDRNKIINELLNGSEQCPASEAVRRIIFHQFGNYVFQQALEVAKDPQFSLLVEHSKPHIQKLASLPAEKTRKDGKPEAAPESASPLPEEGSERPLASEALAAKGSLPLENAKRLATKLVKRYPALLQGMETPQGIDASACSWYGRGAWQGSYSDGCDYGQQWAESATASSEAYSYPFWTDAAGMAAYAGWESLYPSSASAAGRRGGGGRPKGVPAAATARARTKSQRTGAGAAVQRAASRRRKGGTNGKAAAWARGVAGEMAAIPRVTGYWPNYSITYDEVQLPQARPHKPDFRKRKGRGRGTASVP